MYGDFRFESVEAGTEGLPFLEKFETAVIKLHVRCIQTVFHRIYEKIPASEGLTL